MKTIQVDHIDLKLEAGKKLFFASDFHLGSPAYDKSRARERKIIAWIEAHEAEMGGLFLLGDVFDYWFEYRYVVPKGFVRLFGTLARLTDKGIPVFFFCGNHDTWVRNYFQQELGLRVCEQNARLWVNGVKFYVGHGDGLGPDDKGYKFIKRLLAARWSRTFFAMLHPWTGYILASGFSRRSRKADELKTDRRAYEQRKNENLTYFMRERLDEEPDIRYFIFAHRHWPLLQPVKALDETVETDCRYLNVGDWLQYFSYGVYDGTDLHLEGECTEKKF